jgi:hypothetical protein
MCEVCGCGTAPGSAAVRPWHAQEVAELVALIGSVAEACVPQREPWRTIVTWAYVAAGLWGAAVLLLLAWRAAT